MTTDNGVELVPTPLDGANAVVGVDIDYEVLGSDNGMLMVTASGTAVVVQ